MHYSVLLRECLEYLDVRPGGRYLDATCGMGGHTAAIAGRLDTGLVIANDRDAESLRLAQERVARELDPAHAGRIRWHHGRFSQLRDAVANSGLQQLDGLLADLGVSRFQLTEPERGFSFQNEGPLDMRMDRGGETSAADLVNFAAERDLADLIFQLGEERRSRSVARAIVRARPIRSTRHLADVVESVVHRTGRIHPATKTFMALRLAVNEELEEIDALLAQASQLMAPGGRMVVLTFHSLEDRKVKQAFQELARNGHARLLNRHVVTPAEEEVAANAASRSAKLRAIEFTAGSE